MKTSTSDHSGGPDEMSKVCLIAAPKGHVCKYFRYQPWVQRPTPRIGQRVSRDCSSRRHYRRSFDCIFKALNHLLQKRTRGLHQKQNFTMRTYITGEIREGHIFMTAAASVSRAPKLDHFGWAALLRGNYDLIGVGARSVLLRALRA